MTPNVALSAIRKALLYRPLGSWLRELVDTETGNVLRYNAVASPMGVTVFGSPVLLENGAPAPRIATILVNGEMFFTIAQRIFLVRDDVWFYVAECYRDGDRKKALLLMAAQRMIDDGLLVQGVKLEWFMPIESAVTLEENYFE